MVRGVRIFDSNPFIIEVKVTGKVSDDNKQQAIAYMKSCKQNKNKALQNVNFGYVVAFPKIEESVSQKGINDVIVIGIEFQGSGVAI